MNPAKHEEADEAKARELLDGMTAACIKRDCMPGECLQGCLARVEIVAAALSAARREEAERLEPQWARMIEAHRQSALCWEKSACELDAALVAATGCEPRYDHADGGEEIAF